MARAKLAPEGVGPVSLWRPLGAEEKEIEASLCSAWAGGCWNKKGQAAYAKLVEIVEEDIQSRLEKGEPKAT